MTNNRLQMLVRLYIELHPEQTCDEVATALSPDLCAEEFIYEALAELRRDSQVMITGVDNKRIPYLTEMGKRVLDFDKKIVIKIVELTTSVEVNLAPDTVLHQ